TLDLTRREDPCFGKFLETEEMGNLQAEINEVQPLLLSACTQHLISTLQLYFIGKKCGILQGMSRHLEAVLRQKEALRKRLLKPRCQESLPIEATFHKDVVELLKEAVTFIEKLESHLETLRSIPKIPNMMKNMDTALAKTEVLVMELEELADEILKWREQQKEAYSD
ncbi:HAUS2 protein, partial [Syrrhaptes paradoxus]|nr:HAUS2 protein [Syrrhaptes paradoxus]